MLWTALILLVFTSSTRALFNQDEAETYFDLAARALQKALDFFDKEVANVNLDAFIGTRLVDGQLSVLKNHLMRRGWIFKRPEKFAQISQMQELAQHVSDVGLKMNKKTNPKGVALIEPILSKGFWDQDYSTRFTDPSLITTPLYRDREAMAEGNSDYCLGELFGQSKFNKTGKICNITNGCWVLMTSPGYAGYSLTHEVLYLEAGDKFGCHKEMQTLVDFYQQKSIKYLLEGFCVNILQEAKHLSRHKYYWTKQDLFMEQAALCGILGYSDFFRPDWLKTIVSWQTQNGCYKENRPYDYPTDVWRKKKHRRYKREEKVLKDGCLSHKTTVAASALVNYLRYTSEDMDRLQTDK